MGRIDVYPTSTEQYYSRLSVSLGFISDNMFDNEQHFNDWLTNWCSRGLINKVVKHTHVWTGSSDTTQCECPEVR